MSVTLRPQKFKNINNKSAAKVLKEKERRQGSRQGRNASAPAWNRSSGWNSSDWSDWNKNRRGTSQYRNRSRSQARDSWWETPDTADSSGQTRDPAASSSQDTAAAATTYNPPDNTTQPNWETVIQHEPRWRSRARRPQGHDESEEFNRAAVDATLAGLSQEPYDSAGTSTWTSSATSS